jgi:hypothetical protein
MCQRASSLTRIPLKPVENLTPKNSPRNFRGSWQCSDHHVCSARPAGQRFPADGTQTPSHRIAGDRVANRLRDDETKTGWVTRGAIRDIEKSMRCRHTPTPAYGRTKVLGPRHPIHSGEHGSPNLRERITRRARCDPCGGEQQGLHGLHGCACEDGNREPSHDGGCSAEKFSCS